MEGKFIPGDVESGTIDGLTENKSYEFRVRAVNKGGKGEPSEPTKPIIAKSRFGEAAGRDYSPKIDSLVHWHIDSQWTVEDFMLTLTMKVKSV